MWSKMDEKIGLKNRGKCVEKMVTKRGKTIGRRNDWKKDQKMSQKVVEKVSKKWLIMWSKKQSKKWMKKVFGKIAKNVVEIHNAVRNRQISLWSLKSKI